MSTKTTKRAARRGLCLVALNIAHEDVSFGYELVCTF